MSFFNTHPTSIVKLFLFNVERREEERRQVGEGDHRRLQDHNRGPQWHARPDY